MRLLICGLNYAPEKVGIAVYTTGLAEALVAAGHEVTVIAGQPYYPQWRVEEGHPPLGWTRREENGVTVLRVPHYVPRNPTGARRVVHHMSFAASGASPALLHALSKKPQLVIAVAPSLIAAPVARVAARLAGAPSWLHIQDLEVDAAFATGLLQPDKASGRLAMRFERGVIEGFDRISALSPEMCARLAQKGIASHKLTTLRNWADPIVAQQVGDPARFRQMFNIATDNVALYSGNIANKQGIEIIVDAARHLRERGDLTFVVCGDGPNKQALMARAEGLTNIHFAPLQPKEDLPDLLAMATVHLLPQLATAADLVMPSKLTNMLASGRPVVATAAPDTGLAREVEGSGLATPPGDVAAFAAAVASLCADAELRSGLGAAARQRAEQVWGQEAIIGRFLTEIEAMRRSA